MGHILSYNLVWYDTIRYGIIYREVAVTRMLDQRNVTKNVSVLIITWDPRHEMTGDWYHDVGILRQIFVVWLRGQIEASKGVKCSPSGSNMTCFIFWPKNRFAVMSTTYGTIGTSLLRIKLKEL